MANKKVFGSAGPNVKEATTTNRAGGKAYELSAKEALAKVAVTGTFGDTYYAAANAQLTEIAALLEKVDPEFIAKTAIYAKTAGKMKDMPAFLLAYLSKQDTILFSRTAPQILTDVKTVRNFVQIIRSGAVGRKSLGTAPKRAIQQFFDRTPAYKLFSQSVGNDPTITDVIKLARPKPSREKDALYRYFVKGVTNGEGMPINYTELQAFRKGETTTVPRVPFNLLTSSELTKAQWTQLALNTTWQTLRMNLNTFQRHGVFENSKTVDKLAARLADPDEVTNAKVFPYQLLAAYLNADDEVPAKLKNALQQALQVALKNVPAVEGQVYIMVDVSGSMGSAITGRRGAPSKVRCVDVAALVASALLAKNPNATVIPFENDVVNLEINPYDSVMTNAKKIAAVGGGGTNCSAPLARLNAANKRGDLIIYVSDNESWMDSTSLLKRTNGSFYYNKGTALMEQWQLFKRRNAGARLVCLDITPNEHTQAYTDRDVLNIGGFSDDVFNLISDFAVNGRGANTFIERIEKVTIGTQKTVDAETEE